MENDGAKGNSRSPEIHLLVSFLFYLAREWNFSSLRDDDDETYQHRLLEFGRFHRAVMTSIPVSRDDWPFSLNPTFLCLFSFPAIFTHNLFFLFFPSSTSLPRKTGGKSFFFCLTNHLHVDARSHFEESSVEISP